MLDLSKTDRSVSDQILHKAKETKEKIIAKAAPLFNKRGYSGTSISDIMRATGLKKGGIYNHFDSKDELALSAFDYAFASLQGLFARTLKNIPDSPSLQLLSVIRVFSDYADHPPVAGGCPLLNTAIDSDDAHPALRRRARRAMDQWRRLIKGIVLRGIACHEFHATTDGDKLATIIIGTLEGGLMQSKLYNNAIHMHRAVEHLTTTIKTEVISS
ncbi:MAG: TetR/AcrR family transcriptional regulator [Fidelibacterota bacterium]